MGFESTFDEFHTDDLEYQYESYFMIENCTRTCASSEYSRGFKFDFPGRNLP